MFYDTFVFNFGFYLLWWCIYYQWCLYFYQKDFMVMYSCIFKYECIFYYVLGQRWPNKQVKSINQSLSIKLQSGLCRTISVSEGYPIFNSTTSPSPPPPLLDLFSCYTCYTCYTILVMLWENKCHIVTMRCSWNKSNKKFYCALFTRCIQARDLTKKIKKEHRKCACRTIPDLSSTSMHY